MSKPWLKLWVEWLHDPKITALSLAERGAWASILTLAQECDAEGYLVMGNGSPMTLDDIARSLHLTKRKEIQELSSMLTKMQAVGSVLWNSQALLIKNFEERQNTAPSDTKEAARERKRKQRQKEREVQKREPEKNTNRDIDRDIESHAVTGVTFIPPLESNVTRKLGTTIQKTLQKLSENEKSPTKQPYGEFQNVLLTAAEFEKLGIRFGNQKTTEMIERMSAGVASKGYKYKSHYAAILNWDNMDKKRALPGGKLHDNAFYKPQPASPKPDYIDGDAEATTEENGTNL